MLALDPHSFAASCGQLLSVLNRGLTGATVGGGLDAHWPLFRVSGSPCQHASKKADRGRGRRAFLPRPAEHGSICGQVRIGRSALRLEVLFGAPACLLFKLAHSGPVLQEATGYKLGTRWSCK